MGTLPAGAIIFTADATLMDTNIEPVVGSAAVQGWLADFESKLPESPPSNLVIKALEMVMTQNTFQFDSIFWQQFVGTALGTP
jgi:hypothetical protein